MKNRRDGVRRHSSRSPAFQCSVAAPALGIIIAAELFSEKRGGMSMPQMNKGGKFIFGISVVRSDGCIQIPTQAVDEYRIADERKVYLFTGSKSTGGFCMTRQGLLLPSKLAHILSETPELLHYEVPMGMFVPYKGRFWCWTEISESGELRLTEEMMAFLDLKPLMRLLSIRSSNIAFTMGAKGPLWEKAKHFDGEIPSF